MNGTIQFAVNPYLQSKMGSENFGVMLSFISVLSVIAISFGTSLNYSRMIASTKVHDCNSDYLRMLLLAAAVCVPACTAAQFFIDRKALYLLPGYILLTVITMFRYYGDVHFRLNINFKGFFVFYALMAAGYLAGIATYPLFHSWLLVYALAEIAAVIFVTLNGRIFCCNPLHKTPHFSEHLKSSGALFLSNLLTSVLANLDRPLLLAMMDSNAVTVFYTASLVGKIAALLTAPLNGVFISYLAKYNGRLSKKAFWAICVASLGLIVAFSAAGIIVSYPFIHLMYPNVYPQAKSLIPLAIAGQIVYFVSGTLMVVLLRFTKEKWQYIINGLFFAVYLVLCIAGARRNGLMGFTVGILLANVLRMVLVCLLAVFQLENEN